MTPRSMRAAAAFGVVLLLFVLSMFLDPFGPRFWGVYGLMVLSGAVFATRPDRRDERIRAGRCRHCDYDLRGTRGRCPECGKLVPPGTPIRKR